MTAMVDALKRAGKFVLTDHAKERIRQRVGITSEDVAVAWISNEINNAIETKQDGSKTHYISELFEIICDGIKVITVKPSEQTNQYFAKFNEILAKETKKLLDMYHRELRKADISVAESQLNFLKARNPRTKERINVKLAEAVDYKALIEDELKSIEIAAKRYGVSI